MIRVQEEDFDPQAELDALTKNKPQIGAVVNFIGLVRDFKTSDPQAETDSGPQSSMTLEHYPGMTEKMLQKIAADAAQRWPLEGCLIIHRFGHLHPGDRIVMVATASAHRKAAFEACEFLMDWLKTKAPFWKCEHDGSGKDHWVDAKSSDDDATARWL